MKPIAIFRHIPTEGAGYFALFLNEHAIPWQMIHIDQGEAVPADAECVLRPCVHGRADECERRPAVDTEGRWR